MSPSGSRASKLNRSVRDAAFDRDGCMRAKSLAKFLEPPLEGCTLAPPQTMAVELIAADFLSFNIEGPRRSGFLVHRFNLESRNGLRPPIPFAKASASSSPRAGLDAMNS